MDQAYSLDHWWKDHLLPAQGCSSWEVGGRRIWLRQQGRDIAVRSEALAEEATSVVQHDHGPEALEEGASWQRWIVDQERLRVRLLPGLPHLPVVVRPQNPLTVAPQVHVQLYVGLPAVLMVQLQRSPARAAQGDAPPDEYLTIHENPCFSLSQTWFGEPTMGELCLAVASRARRSLGEIDYRPHRILCPLMLHNQSDEPFVIERVCVRVSHSRVYVGNNRLWSNAVHIHYRGADRDNVIEVDEHAPAEAGAASMITPARESRDGKGGRFTLAGLRGAWMSA